MGFGADLPGQSILPRRASGPACSLLPARDHRELLPISHGLPASPEPLASPNTCHGDLGLPLSIALSCSKEDIRKAEDAKMGYFLQNSTGQQLHKFNSELG